MSKVLSVSNGVNQNSIWKFDYVYHRLPGNVRQLFVLCPNIINSNYWVKCMKRRLVRHFRLRFRFPILKYNFCDAVLDLVLAETW